MSGYLCDDGFDGGGRPGLGGCAAWAQRDHDAAQLREMVAQGEQQQEPEQGELRTRNVEFRTRTALAGPQKPKNPLISMG